MKLKEYAKTGFCLDFKREIVEKEKGNGEKAVHRAEEEKNFLGSKSESY